VKKEEIEKYNWMVLASHDEVSLLDDLLEGKIIRRFIDDQWICVTKYEQQLFAFKDKCPHSGASFLRGTCEEGKIVCPLHRYGFDLKTGRGHGLYLENYPVLLHEGQYLIGFEKGFFGF
jgi:nitrite reductase/ring-hydroxylating ferredoxin subunit